MFPGVLPLCVVAAVSTCGYVMWQLRFSCIPVVHIAGYWIYLCFQVILLGLYNAQRLDAEPSRDIITYARSVEVRRHMSVQE